MKYLKARIEKPLTFVSCGHFISDENWKHLKRTIDNFEIILGLNGTTYIQQNDKKYEVKSGDVLLLLPGYSHEGYAVSEAGTSFYWLHFLCKDGFYIIDEKDALVEISPLKSVPFQNKLSESIMIPSFSSPSNMERVLIQFRQLLHIANSNYYTSLTSDYLLTLLMMELTQEVTNNITQRMADSDYKSKRFNNILEWIRMNIQKDLSVQEVAEHFNFNADYLTRLFKKHLGISTQHYINGMKISKAKDLLCHSEKNIKEIAYTLGLKDEKYFMKLFKEYEGLTPTEYRNAYYRTFLNNY